MPGYDLHTHTTASDGTLSPSELVRAAARRGVRVLAVTDHDSTDGSPSGPRLASGGINSIFADRFRFSLFVLTPPPALISSYHFCKSSPKI